MLLLYDRGVDTVSFDSVEYKNSYNKQAYDRIGLMVPKGTKEIWKGHAEKCGFSMNAFIIQAVEDYIEKIKKKE